jgi:hypothetical protein
MLNMILLNLFLGTLVVAVGFWLLWGTFSPVIVAGWALAVGGFLWWKARTITEVWAWSTLFLGLESLAWPLTLMLQLKGASDTPSEDEMGTILSAVVLGLFSSVFWISFSYGLFKRAWTSVTDPPSDTSEPPLVSQPEKQKKAR